MLSFESSIAIAAPQRTVWHLLSDVAAWPRWLPTVTRVQPVGERSLRMGERFVVHQPRLRPATWLVTELNPPRGFAWAARSPGLRMAAEHSVVALSPTTSRAVLRVSFAGPLGVILGWLYRSLTQSYLAQEASSLKYEAERCCTASPALARATPGPDPHGTGDATCRPPEIYRANLLGRL